MCLSEIELKVSKSTNFISFNIKGKKTFFHFLFKSCEIDIFPSNISVL